MDIANVLTFKGLSGWTLHGDGAGGLVWNDATAGRGKPTQTELDTWWSEYIAARDAKAVRANAISAAPDRIDLLNRLRTATAAQIDAYVDANVIEPGVRKLFKQLFKLLALDQRS